MKKLTFCLLLCTLIFACKKEPSIEEVILDFKLSQKEVLADGQSTTKIQVTLSDKSDADRRNVIFKTTAGSFMSAGSSITVKAQFENGLIIASATIKAPFKSGKFYVTAEPEYKSPIKEFLVRDSINAIASQPYKIELEPSSYGISSNYLNQVKITGRLKSKEGTNVSAGFKVLYEDELLSGVKAQGRFREKNITTLDSSKVTTIYQASSYPIGTVIKLKATLLDLKDNKTSISDSILLNINQ